MGSMPGGGDDDGDVLGASLATPRESLDYPAGLPRVGWGAARLDAAGPTHP